VWSVINIDTLDDRALFTDRSETRDYSAETKAVIPSNRSRRRRFRHDKALYRERNRIERCFNKLKHFRRLATRYDCRAVHYLAFLCLAAAMLWMR
jgi:transposase